MFKTKLILNLIGFQKHYKPLLRMLNHALLVYLISKIKVLLPVVQAKLACVENYICILYSEN